MFGRGDLKYALLGLLQEHPKHGYEMIKDLEDRSGGFYSPSAGAIYPTLQLLEDRGWVSVELVEGKKVYTISDEGRKALAEYQERSSGFPFGGPGFGPGFRSHGYHGARHGERAERDERREQERGPRGRGPWGDPRRGPWDWEAVGPELRALAHEGRDIARMMREAVMLSARDPERLKELRSMVERVRGELLTFISQRPDGQPDQPQQRPDQPDQPDQSGGEGPIEHL
jgi:DNA-binding PadR family transcriptional regulator